MLPERGGGQQPGAVTEVLHVGDGDGGVVHHVVHHRVHRHRYGVPGQDLRGEKFISKLFCFKIKL